MKLSVNTEEKYQYQRGVGYFPYRSPVNLCNIYQFAADNVTSNTTVKRNTCSFDNKCCEKCGLQFITNPPLSHIC